MDGLLLLQWISIRFTTDTSAAGVVVPLFADLEHAREYGCSVSATIIFDALGVRRWLRLQTVNVQEKGWLYVQTVLLVDGGNLALCHFASAPNNPACSTDGRVDCT